MFVHNPSAYAAASVPATEALPDAEIVVVVAAGVGVDDDVDVQAASRTVPSAIAASDVRRVMVPLP
jgi:hypothetical protein